jgi:hypothetical protein
MPVAWCGRTPDLQEAARSEEAAAAARKTGADEIAALFTQYSESANNFVSS